VQPESERGFRKFSDFNRLLQNITIFNIYFKFCVFRDAGGAARSQKKSEDPIAKPVFFFVICFTLGRTAAS
jgi:hypothetical protein